MFLFPGSTAGNFDSGKLNLNPFDVENVENSFLNFYRNSTIEFFKSGDMNSLSLSSFYTGGNKSISFVGMFTFIWSDLPHLWQIDEFFN
jgi:hypothetical protein